MDVPRGRPSPTRPLQLLFLLTLTLFSSACVSIPEVPYVVSGRGDGAVIKQEASCREGRLASSDGSGGFHTGGIDPDGFTLLSWNVMKGGRDGWDEDFVRLAAGADLLALQEAYLTEPLHDLLRERDYRWDLAAAFLNRKRETGVLTGSTAAPAFFCVTRFTEPLVVIPKTALTSLYPVAGTDLFLLVANVHLINFTVDTGGYRALLRDLEEILTAHRGPLLLAGDFNTWSGRRMEVVRGLTGRLGLHAVEFPEEGPTAFFGRRVDHVFYRGLEPVEARAVKVSTSDHNPLLVRFRVAKSEGM